MSQEATSMIPAKGLWTLKMKDFVNGLYLAVLPQLYVMLDYWSSSDHFPTYGEWKPYIKASLVILVGYLFKNFNTNNVGQFGKVDKPVVPVDVEELHELKQQAKTNQ